MHTHAHAGKLELVTVEFDLRTVLEAAVPDAVGRMIHALGDAFGGRDHGTVIHACKAVDNMIAQDAHMRGQIEFLRNALSR
jgi:hypothetical protein